MGCADPRVSLLEKSMVVPDTPTNKGHMFLPSLDLFWQDMHYNRRVVFYNTTLADQELLKVLKRSLALVLVHYYPWAGRIAVGGNKRLVIDCNDAGVEFVEASIDVAIADLAKEGFQMKAFFDKLCPTVDHKGECLYTSPLLSVQATSFSDGGLALAFAQSHMVADGQSLWDFMVSWGECARGKSLSIQPVHDRERLALSNPSPEKAHLQLVPRRKEDPAEKDKDENVLADADTMRKKTVDSTDTNTNTHTGTSTNTNTAPEPLLQCFLTLPGAAIQKLKVDAGVACSSFRAICAHVWQRVTVARQAPADQTVHVVLLANGRGRWTPPLPPAYFGNVVSYGMALTTADAICQESLAATAGRVHTAVTSCNYNTLVGFMHWLELHNNRFFVTEKPQTGYGLLVVGSPRFPAYQVDFGWGRPAAVRSVKVQGDGEVVLLGGPPGSAPGDVEICMALSASAMRRLLQDTEFLAKPPATAVF